MKKKMVALVLSFVMVISLSMTAFAAGSSTSYRNSGDQKAQQEAETMIQILEQAVGASSAGDTINTEKIQVAVSNHGSVEAVTLKSVIDQKMGEIKSTIVTTKQVATLMTTYASRTFTEGVQALVNQKGDISIKSAATVKTLSTAATVLGNIEATAGVIEGVSSSSMVMLMGIDEDGTIEYVEGVVDAATGAVTGTFTGTPGVISVLVIE